MQRSVHVILVAQLKEENMSFQSTHNICLVSSTNIFGKSIVEVPVLNVKLHFIFFTEKINKLIFMY